MGNISKRELLSSTVLDYSGLTVNRYNTGLVTVFYSHLPKTKTGADDAIFRITGTSNASKAVVKKLVKLVEETHSPQMNINLEFNENLHLELFKKILKLRESPHYKLALLASALRDVKNLTIEDCIELGKLNYDRLDELAALGQYDLYFRHEFGFYGFYNWNKYNSLEDFKETTKNSIAYAESRIGQLIKAQIETGEKTALVERLTEKRSAGEAHNSYFSYANALLTKQDLSALSEECMVPGYYKVSPAIALLAGALYKVDSEAAAKEFMLFVSRNVVKDRQSFYSELKTSDLDVNGEVTDESLSQAVFSYLDSEERLQLPIHLMMEI